MRDAFPLAIALAMAVALLAIASAGPAVATGVAGDRLFPSTLLVEDTQNDDELELPTLSWLRHGAGREAPGVRELGAVGQFSRLLTPDLALSVGGGWRRLDGGGAGRATGWDNLGLGLKYRALVDEPREFLVSTGLFAEIGGTGARRVGAERFDTIEPVVTFGKGWGDLPRELDWLRPLAVTGAFGMGVPTGPAPRTLRYGGSLQYSLHYMDRHTGIAVAPWLGRLVALVEFSGAAPLGGGDARFPTAVAAPGVAWIGEEMQIAVEALVPLNARTGHGIGAIAQAHFFLDEMMPALFGRPLLSRD